MVLFSDSLTYPRVTSFDALKQSADMCAHRNTFSSRKFIILNNLSIKAYCLGGQRTSFLFKISLSTSVRAPPLFILTDTSFDVRNQRHYCKVCPAAKSPIIGKILHSFLGYFIWNSFSEMLQSLPKV